MSLDAYTSIKLSELQTEAEALGQMSLEFKRRGIEQEAFASLADKLLKGSAGVHCLITDKQGNMLYQSSNGQGASANKTETVSKEIAAALEGKTTMSDRLQMPDDGEQAISICMPVRDENGDIQGSIWLVKLFSEIRRTTDRLNNSLFMAALIVLPVSLILASMSFKRIADPLQKMADVAVEMRRGNFEIRADENEKGEIGLLARALNDLCETLSQTIYQLRTEKGQLKQILASFSEGVVAVDGVGCLTHYNMAVMQMFGAVRVDTRESLIPDEGIWDEFEKVYQSGEPYSMRYPLPGERMLWITISPVVTEGGEKAGVVGLFKDMTQMETLERMRREYVANISHELRTPLTAIRGLLEPLADDMVALEEDKQRYYRIMLREVARLSRLITDMLQLSRLQSGTEYMELIEIDIRETLEDIVKSYSNKAAEKCVEIVLDAPELPRVLTDPDRVEQVLVILIDNALRYTPSGGSVTIRAQSRESVIISVIDTGAGIPEADIPHIFERFYTVDKSRKEGGTGLGLSIAQHIIAKLGEKITVESKVGEGTCFRFTLRKYVRNAIALGPAQEEWDAPDTEHLPPLLKPQGNKSGKAKDALDAQYEVLPEQGKKQSERKKGKERPS